MASQPQSLHPPLPCASGGTGLAAGSSEKGSPRPKPPVRPKPRVLPKPAVPAKPCLPHPPPAPRHSRPELPSAEKINRLAGPQPYSGGGSGVALRRPSFTIKSPETLNGKGLPSPPVFTPEDSCSTPSDEVPPAPSTPSRKGPAPFKVTPVPVATKLERFPGTTVEEILAKMDSKEGSPDRARISPFCSDSSSRFGSKIFTAFRRRPSGEADGDSPGEARQLLQQAEGELGTGGDRCPMVEMSSISSPAGASCAGDPCGLWRPPSPPDLSSLQLGPPGSPRSPACPPPGAPFQPAEPSAAAPGSPDAPPELLAPGSPTMALESPRSPAQPPTEELLATSIQAPGAPSSVAEPWLGASRSPGSPHTPSEGSPTPASPSTLGAPQLSPRATCPPGSPESATQPSPSPSPPPELPARASRPPGSPGGPDDSPVSSRTPEGPDFSPPPSNRDSGLRRSSEGVLRPPPSEGQGMGLLGGSLGALPQPGDQPAEHLLSSESSWSLSQSFEWTFPTRGARGLPSPPRSPIQEAADSGLSEEDESDREGAATGSHGDSGDADGPGFAVTGSWGAEGAPCPGGPVAQQESESSEEEEEEEAELDSTELHIVEPILDPAEPEPPVKATPPDPAPTEADTWEPADEPPASLQGLGGPGQDEGSSKGPDAHADPRWLTELLASPRARASGRDPLKAEEQEGLLGWSRKDLCSEFGIGRSHQAGAFDWSHKAVARQGDWPGEMEQDQKFRTNSSRNNSCGISDMNQQDRAFGAAERDWSSNYKGTELMGDTRLGSSDWSKSHGARESCLQDQDFSKPTWGTGYGLDSAGSREEVSSGKAEWGSPYSVGHGQQQDKELSSRQPGWAGKYGSGDLEAHGEDASPVWSTEYGTGDADIKDREVTPSDWASKYSSRDAETKDKDFTLGWAGRSSTGDAGTPDKEFCSSRSAWDSKYSTRDMDSQDREFSPSRPAWSGEYSTQDMESQDREFSPSRPAEASEYSSRDMEIQDREFSPSRPACAEEHSTSDMESQDGEFSTSRPTWHSEYSSRDMESQDREFSPSRPACTDEYSTSNTETQDRDLNPSRLTWHSEYSSRDMESQDREFSPSRPACTDEYSTRDMETQDREFSPSRLAEASEYSTRDVETQDRELKSNKPAWDDGYITKNMESQDREFGPSRSVWASDYGSVNTTKGEFSSSRLSWAGECSIGQTELANAFGVGKDLPGLCAPSRPGHESSWGSTDQSESGTKDWAEELRLGGAEHQNQFGIIGTERVSDSSSTAVSADSLMSWADKMRSEVPQESRQPLEDWHSDLSFSTSGVTGKADEGEPNQMAWDEGLTAVGSSAQPQQAKVEEPGWSQDLEEAGWSEELREAEARRQEWASAFGARCAARSQDFSAGEQSLGGDDGSADRSPENIHLSDSSPPLGDDAVAEPAAAEPLWGESAAPLPRTDPMEQQDLPELAAAPLPPEAAGETLETVSEETPSDHPDGKRPVSWEEKRLSASASQPEGLLDLSGQDFTFLEDTEVLDSTMYRSKANLGRKRRHRAPVLRLGATSEGDSWIFQDSTEPRPARAAASSDEEAAEEPKSRRVRASPSGKGVKVPLFPGLTTSALKAKLRGRNRSVEEGASPMDSKATPTKDPHVQRSKSCKIPGLSGKPLVLPPKPEKSSGSDASPPHWLQALKLKKKKS
ncbi:182 kDa tankyrase-1-binding protein isoform X1 [Coturnix japonica]|uniref:182 kDa tankyrase-1-binding protein isoform X1 n=1 Tax=Coturnix japonica TaxID=93934 RepID=UPI000777562E|nr:182 kDa tankyrase-1-binding protein isoform X1 [Coturnix japonica]XP_015719151.1 182 kDa tankyrase-1-binding protein isoform X1 [Coturnix japonica]XP_015719152.1 182 kDa tankyrase-1-binding protein isoform X1 [Coturnix japonica]